jgi:hypothetical protein
MIGKNTADASMQLTRLPSLEILDVSRNRLRALPFDLGNLMNLKVWTPVERSGGVRPVADEQWAGVVDVKEQDHRATDIYRGHERPEDS